MKVGGLLWFSVIFLFNIFVGENFGLDSNRNKTVYLG